MSRRRRQDAPRLRRELHEAQWEIDYWHLLATSPRRRAWTLDSWSRPQLGLDELGRRTLAIGRWVIALWRCRCTDCTTDLAHLTARVQEPTTR